MAQLLSGGRGFELKRIGLAIVGTLIYAVGMNLFGVPAAPFSGYGMRVRSEPDLSRVSAPSS
mgnify:CR=1 FL=1